MNEMNTLSLYRRGGMWVYDDPIHNRVSEPFVLGASEALDELRILDGLGPGTNPFDIIFSAQPFPEAHAAHRLHHKDGFRGAWYQFDQRTFWLCPALLDFFEFPPESLYVKALPGWLGDVIDQQMALEAACEALEAKSAPRQTH